MAGYLSIRYCWLKKNAMEIRCAPVHSFFASNTLRLTRKKVFALSLFVALEDADVTTHDSQ
jgi:hypothetical protein